MSLVSTYVKAVDGKWYQDPVLEGVSDSGHKWFLCFDDEDPPELVYQWGSHRDPAGKVLRKAGIRWANMRHARASTRCFLGGSYMADGYFVDLTSPIPVPARYDAVFEFQPQRDGCYYGFEGLDKAPAEPSNTQYPITNEHLIRAFVQGAKWWEWEITGRRDGASATMWQSDQKLAYEAAQERLKEGTLGKDQLEAWAKMQQKENV